MHCYRHKLHCYPFPVVGVLTMITLKPIKGTALNRGKPRIWLSERDLSAFGFEWKTPVNIVWATDCITILKDEHGKRKMNGRLNPKGKSLALLDMTCSHEQRESIRMGCAKLKVEAEHGRIVISADFDTLGA